MGKRCFAAGRWSMLPDAPERQMKQCSLVGTYKKLCKPLVLSFDVSQLTNTSLPTLLFTSAAQTAAGGGPLCAVLLINDANMAAV